jgi:hypothetical protein
MKITYGHGNSHRRILLLVSVVFSFSIGHSADAAITSAPKALHDSCAGAYASYLDAKSASEEADIELDECAAQNEGNAGACAHELGTAMSAELARIRAWDAFLDCFLGAGVR